MLSKLLKCFFVFVAHPYREGLGPIIHAHRSLFILVPFKYFRIQPIQTSLNSAIKSKLNVKPT